MEGSINMISLKEILHIIGDEKKSGLINVDSWRWPDVDHLATMGFGFDGDYYMRTDKDPEMRVYKKKENDPVTKKKTEFFYLDEEPSNGLKEPDEKKEKQPTKRFKNFSDLIDYFDTYEQPEIDKNM